METPIIVAIIAGGVALVSAALTMMEKARTARITAELGTAQKRLEGGLARSNEAFRAELARQARDRELSDARDQVVARFRKPLARSAYDLQSRIWNILKHNFLIYLHGDERERIYALKNTVYVIGQYFAWAEIIRREIDYVDLGADEGTRTLAHLQDEITKLWGTDRSAYGTALRIWAGEQRAIGEMLIAEGSRGSYVMGYGAFLAHLEQSPSPLLSALCDEVLHLESAGLAANQRLVQLQHSLIDLLAHLDPAFLLFPEKYRQKV